MVEVLAAGAVHPKAECLSSSLTKLSDQGNQGFRVWHGVAWGAGHWSAECSKRCMDAWQAGSEKHFSCAAPSLSMLSALSAEGLVDSSQPSGKAPQSSLLYIPSAPSLTNQSLGEGRGGGWGGWLCLIFLTRGHS